MHSRDHKHEDEQTECEDSTIATDELMISPGVFITGSLQGDNKYRGGQK